MDKIAHIRFRTHSVHITQDPSSGLVHCFKYAQTCCDLESFTDIDLAADYIALPFDEWRFVIEVREAG